MLSEQGGFPELHPPGRNLEWCRVFHGDLHQTFIPEFRTSEHRFIYHCVQMTMFRKKNRLADSEHLFVLGVFAWTRNLKNSSTEPVYFLKLACKRCLAKWTWRAWLSTQFAALTSFLCAECTQVLIPPNITLDTSTLPYVNIYDTSGSVWCVQMTNGDIPDMKLVSDTAQSCSVRDL